jgi:hypothetical protein
MHPRVCMDGREVMKTYVWRIFESESSGFPMALLVFMCDVFALRQAVATKKRQACEETFLSVCHTL